MRIIGNNPNFAGENGNLIATKIEEDWFFSGKAFAFEDYFLFATDEVKTFVFDPTNCDCDKIVNFPITLYSTSGPIIVDIYIGTLSADDGTLLQPINRKFGGDPPKSTIRLNSTIQDLGLRIGGDIVPGTGLNPQTSTGGSNTGILPLELNKNFKNTLSVYNANGAGVYLVTKFTWFEV